MKCPHTHFTRGKRVFIILRDGTHVVGKFQDRTSRYVILDTGRYATDQIRSMSFHRWKTDNGGRRESILVKLTDSVEGTRRQDDEGRGRSAQLKPTSGPKETR